MLKSSITSGNIRKIKMFPKLMRGIQTGAIYLAHGRDFVYGLIDTTTLHRGESSDYIGAKNKYDESLLEDFDGSVTVSSFE